MLEITSDRGLKLQFFEATINLASISVFYTFGGQLIMGRVLSCLVIFISNFWQYLILVAVSYSLDFCVCKYFDVELFLFG